MVRNNFDITEFSNKKLWRYFIDESQDQKVIEEIRRRVRQDDPDGFQWFYRLIRSWPLPPYGARWLNDLYASGGRWLNKAFRGSAKTTTITETFMAYQIGLHPARSNGFAQASDDSAKASASNVADIIEHNPGWKLLFPSIVPDERAMADGGGKGWGAKGYWVRDTDMPYGDWVRVRHKDPTMFAGSYRNAIHIGKHPTGVFAFDDVNDRKNTESERRNQEVNDWFKDTMSPAQEGTHWRIFNQTPWTKRDLLAYIEDTGIWPATITPVLYPMSEGEGELVRIEKDGIILYEQWARLTWPNRFHPKRIAEAYLEEGRKDFLRMYLLDLKATEGMYLKREWLHDYEELDLNWPTYFGVDYASAADNVRGDGDYFALTVVLKTPGEHRIVYDGFRGKLSQGEAEAKVKAIAMTYPSLVSIGIEMDGSGKEFYNLLARTSSLPIIPGRTKGKKKGYRFEKVMAPYFEFSRARLAGEKTLYLRVLMDDWVAWSGKKDDESDVLDATFYALAASGLFFEQAQEDSWKSEFHPWFEKQEPAPSPWKQLAGISRRR